MTRDNFHAKLDEAEAMVQEMGAIIYDLMTQLISVYRTHELSADLVDTLKHESAHDKQYDTVIDTGWNVLRRFVQTPINAETSTVATAIEGQDPISEDVHWDPMEIEAYDAQGKP